MMTRHPIRFLLSIVLFCSNITATFATTSLNCAEMGMALSAMTADIIANRYEVKEGSTVKTALLHCGTDLLNIAREVLFFENNPEFQRGHWSRDSRFNTIFVAHDVMRLYRHVKMLFAEQSEEGTVAHKTELEKDLFTIAHACKVVIIPALKGLTALAIACTQDNATRFGSVSYAGQRALYTATAAHSFMRLFEEYYELEAESPYRNVLIVALCANAAWLICEMRLYLEAYADGRINRMIEQVRGEYAEPVVADVMRPGVCPIAALCDAPDANGNHNLRVLHCGHAFCEACLNAQLDVEYGQRGGAGRGMYRVLCPDPNCRLPHLQHNLTRGDLELITRGGDPVRAQTLLNEYDRAKHEALDLTMAQRVPGYLSAAAREAAQRQADAAGEAERQEMMRQGLGQYCPGPCRRFMMRDGGCAYMTCNRCDVQHCALCGVQTQGHAHPAGAQNCRAARDMYAR